MTVLERLRLDAIKDVLRILDEVQNGEEYSNVHYEEDWKGIYIACDIIREKVLALLKDGDNK